MTEHMNDKSAAAAVAPLGNGSELSIRSLGTSRERVAHVKHSLAV